MFQQLDKLPVQTFMAARKPAKNTTKRGRRKEEEKDDKQLQQKAMADHSLLPHVLKLPPVLLPPQVLVLPHLPLLLQGCLVCHQVPMLVLLLQWQRQHGQTLGTPDIPHFQMTAEDHTGALHQKGVKGQNLMPNLKETFQPLRTKHYILPEVLVLFLVPDQTLSCFEGIHIGT